MPNGAGEGVAVPTLHAGRITARLEQFRAVTNSIAVQHSRHAFPPTRVLNGEDGNVERRLRATRMLSRAVLSYITRRLKNRIPEIQKPAREKFLARMFL